MDALEIRVSRIVSSLHQSLKACLHQCAYAAAEHCLLSEEVCLCLCAEGGLQNACPCAADSQSVSQSFIQSLSCSVLLNGYETGNTLSCLVFASYSMARSLGSDHRNIHICGRYNLAEMNRETMRKHQHISCFQVRRDILLVHICLLLIVDQNHNDVCPFCRLCSCINLKALFLCLFPGFTSLVQTNDDITSGLF